MGSIGPAEILVVLVVALIVLGPNRLPEAARSVGKAMAELRRVTSGVQDEVREAFSEAPTYPAPPPPAPPAAADRPTPSVPSAAEQAFPPVAANIDATPSPPSWSPSSPEQAEVMVVPEPEPPASA